jgi:hypothetical protein
MNASTCTTASSHELPLLLPPLAPLWCIANHRPLRRPQVPAPVIGFSPPSRTTVDSPRWTPTNPSPTSNGSLATSSCPCRRYPPAITARWPEPARPSPRRIYGQSSPALRPWAVRLSRPGTPSWAGLTGIVDWAHLHSAHFYFLSDLIQINSKLYSNL